MSSAASPNNTPSTVAAVVPLVPVWRVDRSFDYAVPETLLADVSPGTLVRVPFGGRRVRGIVIEVGVRTSERPLEQIAQVIVSTPVCPPPLTELMSWIALRYCTARGKTFMRVVPPRVRVKTPTPSYPSVDGPSGALPGYDGGTDLIHALEHGEAGTFCFHVLSGDSHGRLIGELVAAAARAGNGTSLVAVPEVRYGSLVLDELTVRWPDAARVDSSRSDSDRTRSWLQLASGHHLGLGGRTSTLAPAPELRLVVVDDEDHQTYKEDRSPRYDTRRVAEERARLQGAVCVLMSSTPSIESAWAARSGRFRWVGATRDRRRATRPVVEDTEVPADRAISHLLHERIRDCLKAGGRAALLAPTRGYARALWCAGCRRSVRCPRCEAGLFFDRSSRRVRCARCSWVGPAPDSCPTCKATDLRYVGAGSERLQEQLARSFPRARVARVDPDVLESGLPEDLEKSDIYVTTWIGTKPVIRPAVSLVAVLDADALIRRPDFRAAEHAYRALALMAEWAGPAAEGGRLIVQTSEPGHHSVQAVIRGDFRFFLEKEAPLRKELRYPPFSELIKIVVRGEERDELAGSCANACKEVGAEVLGPISVSERGREGSSLQLLAKCSDGLEAALALRKLVAGAPPGVVDVDVDPR